MAYGRDHGDVRGRNGARQAFIVKGEQIFERTSAARHHDHIHLAVAVEVADARADFRGGTLALHLCGIDKHANRLVPAAKNVQNVLDSSAARGGHHSDAPGQRWDRPLTTGFEQPFRSQLGLQLLEGNLECASALGFEVFCLKLQVAALVVNGESTTRDNLQAVLRTKAQQSRLGPPHHHPQLRRAILQREVKMSRFGRPVVGDFAFHVNVGEGALHLGANCGDQLAHRIDFARRRLEGQPELLRVGHGKSVWRQCIN